MEDNFNFDKFMDDLIIRGAQKKRIAVELERETPQREYARKYRELPANRIRVP